MIKTSKYSVYIPDSGSSLMRSLRIANALYAELLNFGVEMSPDLFKAIATSRESDAINFASELAKEFSIGNVNKPLFEGWEDRTFMSFNEIVVQICGYMFQFSGNDFNSVEFVANLKRNVDISSLKTLQLTSFEDFESYANELVNSAVSQDRQTLKAIANVFKYLDSTSIRTSIKSDEVRVAVLLEISKRESLYDAFKLLRCKPADALRYAAAKVKFEFVKLPADLRYANLSWKERINIFRFLNEFDFDFLAEGMGTNREAWSKFLKHTHFFSQKKFFKRFDKFYNVAFVSVGNKLSECKDFNIKDIKNLIFAGKVAVTDSGNTAYRTFASRMQTAIEDKNFDEISKLCIDRPGYVFRNLATVFNGISKTKEKDFVALIRGLLSKGDPGAMLSILSINVNSEFRIIDVKGDTRVEPSNYTSVIADIQGDIKRELNNRFRVSGKISVDPELQNNVVPFLSKNSELPRGTKIKIDTDNVYFFMHWVQKPGRRTDLDHSYIAFDDNWKATNIAFYNQANAYLTHGGDITDAPAPNGATEYGKIRFSLVPNNIRFIVPIINVYIGDVFSELVEARAGFWCSDKDKFTLSDEAVYYNLNSPAQMNAPFVIDCKNKEIIMIDFNARDRYGSIAADYQNTIKKVALASTSTNYVTIKNLADMLSGDEREESLIVSNTKEGANVIRPEHLSKLFNL